MVIFGVCVEAKWVLAACVAFSFMGARALLLVGLAAMVFASGGFGGGTAGNTRHAGGGGGGGAGGGAHNNAAAADFLSDYLNRGPGGSGSAAQQRPAGA